MTKAGTKSRKRRRQPDALRESLNHSAADNDSAPPQDIDAFRLALTRRIRTLLGDARRCREPVCRRARRCAGPTMRCAQDFPSPPASEEQWSRVKVDILQALKRRAAELGL